MLAQSVLKRHLLFQGEKIGREEARDKDQTEPK